jgi:hypothetical protein
MSHLDFGIVAEMGVAYAYPKGFKLKNQVNMRGALAASRKALNLGISCGEAVAKTGTGMP